MTMPGKEYAEWLLSLRGLLSGEQRAITCLANASGLLAQALDRINWLGFYLLDGGKLWLGPFQGKPACTSVEPGKGVCGTALVRNETITVPDVHAFPGHIACDEASRSEIVIPLRMAGRAIGVLDVDSPELDRFGPAERAFLEEAVRAVEGAADLSRIAFDGR